MERLRIIGADLVLLLGGLFLLGKSVVEILQMLERTDARRGARVRGGFEMLVPQIALIDIVFSLDSVFMVVGLVEYLAIMASAIVMSILVMTWVSGLGERVHRTDHCSTIEMLALSFLTLWRGARR